MRRWTAIALALRRPDDDRLRSRLPTYLHPLAGRSLVWHVLRTATTLASKPLQLMLVSGDQSLASGLDDLRAETIFPARGVPWAAQAGDRLHPSCEQVLVVDAAAAALDASLRALLTGPAQRSLRARDGSVVAVWLERHRFIELSRTAPDLDALADGCSDLEVEGNADVFAVRDRASLAEAGGRIRDRLVAALMEGGATFLDPSSVLVDVDVRIGTDTVIYPGVVLEGGTTIGSETVIGPSCRIVDSQVGSGVELKGWNYLVGTTIRNRAVLEPYVRRGYD